MFCNRACTFSHQNLLSRQTAGLSDSPWGVEGILLSTCCRSTQLLLFPKTLPRKAGLNSFTQPRLCPSGSQCPATFSGVANEVPLEVEITGLFRINRLELGSTQLGSPHLLPTTWQESPEVWGTTEARGLPAELRTLNQTCSKHSSPVAHQPTNKLRIQITVGYS